MNRAVVIRTGATVSARQKAATMMGATEWLVIGAVGTPTQSSASPPTSESRTGNGNRSIMSDCLSSISTDARAAVRDAIDRLRTMLFELHPPSLERDGGRVVTVASTLGHRVAMAYVDVAHTTPVNTLVVDLRV